MEAHPRALHVLGNHDIDGGHSFDEVVKLWKMKGRYYTENIQGLNLVVLDGNEKPADHKGGYPSIQVRPSSTGSASSLKS